MRSTWSAPVVGAGVTAQLSLETLKGVGDLFVKLGHSLAGLLTFDSSSRQSAGSELGSLQQNVAGPVGLIGTILPGIITAGPIAILTITAIISLTLAVMNILPIPALDGGRFYTMALFRLIKKPLTKELEEKINAVGFMVLMVLILLVTISDVSKFL